MKEELSIILKKAQRYDEALERMKSWSRGEHPECFTEAQKAAEYIFPELKESEDERIKKTISDILLIDSDEIREILDANKVLMQDIDNWLKKQGEQKSAEWSEEDESMLNDIIHNIHFAEIHRNVTGSFAMEKELVNWLKSIKDRIGCETNCTTLWKPSEEQIRALHDLNLTGNLSYAGQGQTLINLYNDLKKLTE